MTVTIHALDPLAYPRLMQEAWEGVAIGTTSTPELSTVAQGIKNPGISLYSAPQTKMGTYGIQDLI